MFQWSQLLPRLSRTGPTENNRWVGGGGPNHVRAKNQREEGEVIQGCVDEMATLAQKLDLLLRLKLEVELGVRVTGKNAAEINVEGALNQRTCKVSPSKTKPSDGIVTALRVPAFFTRPAIHASWPQARATPTTASAASGAT
jgi:hypothetical protein